MLTMRIKIIFTFLLAGVFTGALAQKITRLEYIKRYKALVVEQQDIYGIPASIKMAQALLESENGNSRLAIEANNHFGIKCKKDWTGQTISHDDDAMQECFRKYNSVEESFKDHSEFLDKSPRYQDLFKLDPLDYKGWAYGLKAAGYATSPKYPELLLAIIEENQLYLLDQGKDLPSGDVVTERPFEPQEPVVYDGEKIDIDNYVVSINTYKGYTLYSNNGSEFVVTAPGDTFAGLSTKLGISQKKLRKFNDQSVGEPSVGGMVYIKAKAKRSNNGKLMHYVKDGETMHSISQLYGIRLKNLYNMNRLSPTVVAATGQQIRLM